MNFLIDRVIDRVINRVSKWTGVDKDEVLEVMVVLGVITIAVVILIWPF